MRRLAVLLAMTAVGCHGLVNLFESGYPGSSGHVEEQAPPVETSLVFVTGKADHEGTYDVAATFSPAEFPAFLVR